MSFRQRVLGYLKARLSDDPVPVRLIFWDGERFDLAATPKVAITLHSPRLLKMMLRGDFARLGDAYASGELTVDGEIEDILQIGIALAERIGKSSAANWAGRASRLIRPRHSRTKDAADISYHYDVSNDFYRLWLDERMVYSCAYFPTGTEDIDEAQQRKLDHICRKLLLKPGDRLLDIGCGWGGLLHWAAQHYGVTGVGITLSERQCRYARERLKDDGLDEQVDIRLQDYRDLDEAASFDKIVSVGMYEHVGLRNLPLYFSTAARLLRPGGAILNHGIVTTDPHGRARGPPGGEFIDRYVFPGGEVPHLSRAIFELASANLELADVEDLRPHYARTLWCWTRRLEENRDEAIRTAGPGRYRIWRVYLAGMAHAFDRGWLSVAQVLAYKPTATGAAPRPWTRDHQYRRDYDCRRDGDPPLAERLDWRRPQ